MAVQKKRKKKARKPRTIKVGALNVAAHPHEDRSVYEQLFRQCTRGPIAAQYHGKQTAVISHFRKHEGVFVGMLTTFFRIDSADVWGNPVTGEEATEEELKQIRLPKNLHPSFKRHTFIFSPNKHRVVFDARDLSPTLWGRAVGHLLATAGEQIGLEKVVTTVEPTHDSVETVLDMDVARLTITLERPNPDDLQDLDAEVAERMEKQNVDREVRDLRARRGYSIEPDEATLKLADVAKSNGKVEAVGYVDDQRESRSTSDYPWTLQIVLDAGPIQGAVQKALRFGLDTLNKIRRSQ